MSETASPNKGIKRFFRKVLLYIAGRYFFPGKWRVYLVSAAGVNFPDKSNIFIGYDVTFDDIYPFNITIGKNARITSGTKILTHFLDTNQPPFVFIQGKISIGDNVFIGSNSLIVKECAIGNNVVIAAGSVVNGDVPDNWIVGGVPAKKLGERLV